MGNRAVVVFEKAEVKDRSEVGVYLKCQSESVLAFLEAMRDLCLPHNDVDQATASFFLVASSFSDIFPYMAGAPSPAVGNQYEDTLIYRVNSQDFTISQVRGAVVSPHFMYRRDIFERIRKDARTKTVKALGMRPEFGVPYDQATEQETKP